MEKRAGCRAPDPSHWPHLHRMRHTRRSAPTLRWDTTGGPDRCPRWELSLVARSVPGGFEDGPGSPPRGESLELGCRAPHWSAVPSLRVRATGTLHGDHPSSGVPAPWPNAQRPSGLCGCSDRGQRASPPTGDTPAPRSPSAGPILERAPSGARIQLTIGTGPGKFFAIAGIDGVTMGAAPALRWGLRPKGSPGLFLAGRIHAHARRLTWHDHEPPDQHF